MGLTPILYALSKNLFVLTLMQPITGFFTAGTTVAILGSLLQSSSDKFRTMSVAIHATLTSITLAVAPLLGAYIVTRTSIVVAVIITALLRLLGSRVFYLRYKMDQKKS